MNTTITLSKKGYKELKKSIIKNERELSKVRNKLRTSDKDNSRDGKLARIETLSLLESLEQELVEQRTTLKNATIANSAKNQMSVAIGSVVELIDKHGRKFKYTVVESIEANPLDGRISANSPLGMKLIGKTIKDTIEYVTRSGTQQMRLLAIS